MDKLTQLKEYIKTLGSAAIAFSGGVDSTFLLRAAHDAIGENAVAVTIRSGTFPKSEDNKAAQFCRDEGIRQIILEFDEMSVPGFRNNPPDRCYICKKAIFSAITETAAAYGITNVCEGSNMDDMGDYRPGMRAIAELGILSPLRHAGLTKAEIRAYSKKLGLKTYNAPSFACLATRFAYGEEITPERLAMVEKAEDLLSALGFSQYRVRVHGTLARIEINRNEFDKLLTAADRIYDAFKTIGFSYVSLDLKGYRTGSMNEVLRDSTFTP